MSTKASINVDENEIEKFSKLASRWWDPSSEFKPLHEINPLRTDYINTISPVKGKRILDVGCGGGILAEALALLGADVTGIDLADASLNVAKIHQLESGVSVDYKKISAEELAETEAEQFDIVTCLEMLEHVPDPASIVSACTQLLKPGGDIYFSTINRSPKSYLFAVIGAEYILKLLPKGTHDYEKFIKPSELVAWMRAAQLLHCNSTGLIYNPLTKKYSLDKNDISVNYLLHAKKLP